MNKNHTIRRSHDSEGLEHVMCRLHIPVGAIRKYQRAHLMQKGYTPVPTTSGLKAREYSVEWDQRSVQGGHLPHFSHTPLRHPAIKCIWTTYWPRRSIVKDCQRTHYHDLVCASRKTIRMNHPCCNSYIYDGQSARPWQACRICSCLAE